MNQYEKNDARIELQKVSDFLQKKLSESLSKSIRNDPPGTWIIDPNPVKIKEVLPDKAPRHIKKED